jgi:8-oxo-dGTP diphosphatase
MDEICVTPNPFEGCIIEPDSLASDPETFRGQLESGIRRWKSEGFKVAWLRLEPRLAGLIPPAVEAGFTFHHADEEGVQLTLRLQEAAFIPPYATHYIGAGGVVVRDRSHLLVVSERHHRRQGRIHYKLPGGALHPGEHIEKAVVREVREETGIRTRFLSLQCFRHWHGYRHGKSDIYFVCRLEPLSFEISRQEDEIAECLWMPLEDYLENETIHAFNRRIVRASLEGSGFCLEEIDGYGTPETHEFFMPVEDRRNRS